MSIALFVESNAGELDNQPATAQTLLFAHGNKVNIYHRISNGSKGKGQVWKSVSDVSALPNTPIGNVPVGVVLTERDLALADLGQITNIAIKAIYANENADPVTEVTAHREVVNNLISRLIYGDQALADLVLDKRSTTGMANGIVINPIDEAVIESVEPVVEPANTNFDAPSIESEQTVTSPINSFLRTCSLSFS